MDPIAPAPAAAEPVAGEPAKQAAAPAAEDTTSASLTDRHIFVSYKSEDRQRAMMVAQALERRGWPVWWDRDIQAGQAFRRVIGQALNDAACIVVLWTNLSIDSEWVQEEAQEGKARRILVPALLDDVRPPLGFGQMQAASLVGWTGEADDPMLEDLLRGVAARMGTGGIPPLLGDAEWAEIVESERIMRGRASVARATEERAAAAIAREDAERAASERVAAAEAGHTAVEVDAARREAEANEAADQALREAEEREAQMAAELAAEHAAELRAVAARRAAKESEAKAAEEAAARAERAREDARTTGEQEAAVRAAEHAASLRAAKEAAEAAERTASRMEAVKADPKRWSASGLGATEPAAKASWFRFPNEGVATLLGAVLVGISATLPWQFGEETALDYPLEYLVDPDAIEGSGLGGLLLTLAVVGAILALFRIPRSITVILGAVATAVALAFLIQIVRMLEGDSTVEDFFTMASVGPAVTIAGGLLMLSGR